MSALLLLWSGFLAASAHAGIPVGGPSLCPTPDSLWQELASLLAQQDLAGRLEQPVAGDSPVRVDDLGPSFRVSLLGRSRDYLDEGRDCARRARIGALFAALVLDRGGKRERAPTAPGAAVPAGGAKVEAPAARQGAEREAPSAPGVDGAPLAGSEPRPEGAPLPAPSPAAVVPAAPSVPPAPPPAAVVPAAPVFSAAATGAVVRIEAAGALMVGLDERAPGFGGVLRLSLGDRRLGPTVGVGGFWPVETNVAGIRLRQWRVPADLGVRASLVARGTAYHGELGVVAALLGEGAVELVTKRAGTAVEVGGRLGLGARWPARGTWALLLAASLDVIPYPPAIRALPKGEAGHTSHLWGSLCLGVAWGIR